MTGTEVREARLAAGLTQEQLAHRAGVAFATISRIENGRGRPQAATVAVISAALERAATEGPTAR